MDRKRSPMARRGSKPSTPDTGDFEHIFRQSFADCPRYVGNTLNIEGKGLLKEWICIFVLNYLKILHLFAYVLHLFYKCLLA